MVLCCLPLSLLSLYLFNTPALGKGNKIFKKWQNLYKTVEKTALSFKFLYLFCSYTRSSPAFHHDETEICQLINKHCCSSWASLLTLGKDSTIRISINSIVVYLFLPQRITYKGALLQKDCLGNRRLSCQWNCDDRNNVF